MRVRRFTGRQPRTASRPGVSERLLDGTLLAETLPIRWTGAGTA
jgi:hypothetical protein